MSRIFQFIENLRFMASSIFLKEFVKLSVSEYGHGYKIFETCEIKYKDFDCFPVYLNFKDDLILIWVDILGVGF